MSLLVSTVAGWVEAATVAQDLAVATAHLLPATDATRLMENYCLFVRVKAAKTINQLLVTPGRHTLLFSTRTNRKKLCASKNEYDLAERDAWQKW